MAAILLFSVRALAFCIGFLFYSMETAADWLIGVRNRTEYVRVGACKRCGRCCQLLALEMPDYIAKNGRFADFLSRWHKVLFNFQYQGREGKLLVYTCRYLVEPFDSHSVRPELDEGRTLPAQGERAVSCRVYHFRHRICRFYPRQRLYGHPKTHPDCGFKFVRRDGKPAFDEVLEQKRKSL